MACHTSSDQANYCSYNIHPLSSQYGQRAGLSQNIPDPDSCRPLTVAIHIPSRSSQYSQHAAPPLSLSPSLPSSPLSLPPSLSSFPLSLPPPPSLSTFLPLSLSPLSIYGMQQAREGATPVNTDR